MYKCVFGYKCVSIEYNVSASSKNVSASSTNVSASTTNVSSTCSVPNCGFQQKESRVVFFCLNYFLDSGTLYRFDYGVSKPIFLCRITAAHAPLYNLILQRKIVVKILPRTVKQVFLPGSNGQDNSVIFAPLATIISLPLKLFMSSSVSVARTTSRMYFFSRYTINIGVGSDVLEVKVKDLTSSYNLKNMKKSINKNHFDTKKAH
ncbi:uncharacterized protein LOC107849000 [Capsicum annuum]|uniref:uncharacterized protein LOC107849000 n=1 Tax=Capsicum annuum TaxID=4072 RepID=UPI001FB0E5E4|nr:uncharacterized protein LOC107849000 [Capsicum annuum]